MSRSAYWIVAVLGLLSTMNCSIPKEDNFVLFADGGLNMLYWMSLDGHVSQQLPQESITNTSKLVAVDYDPVARKVYWSDLGNSVIMRSDMEGQDEEVILQLGPQNEVEGIAVDPYAGLLFFSDDATGTLNVLSLQPSAKQSDRKVLVRNLKHPRSVRVDPATRLIYWADRGLHRIESIKYDGTDRKVVITINNAGINGLALDLMEGRLYWSNAVDNTIETARLDGSEHNTLVQAKEINIYGVAVDERNVFYTDWFNGTVFKTDKQGKNAYPIGPSDFGQLFDIHVFERDRMVQGGETGCSENNGGCESICIPTTALSYQCVCSDTKRLNTSDQKSCSSGQIGPDLMWLENDPLRVDGYVRGIKGDPKVYLDTNMVRTWGVRTHSRQWTQVDFNYKTSQVYLFDTVDRCIAAALSMNGSLRISIIHKVTSNYSEVAGLAYDWLAGTLYWTDAMYNWIQVGKVAATPMTHWITLFKTGLDQPHGIAVYPSKGLLFWTDWGARPKIERSTLAGTNRQTLTDVGLVKPTGLAIDYSKDKIYFSNGQQIIGMNMDGTGRENIASTTSGSYLDISIFNSYVFATESTQDKKNNKFWFYDTEGDRKNGKLLTQSRQVSGVVMYDQSRQPVSPSGCEGKSCQHLCVSAANNAGECMCYDGYKIQPDGKSCVEISLFQGNHYVYALGNRICSMEAGLVTTTLIGKKKKVPTATLR